jgi:hypothetical protein
MGWKYDQFDRLSPTYILALTIHDEVHRPPTFSRRGEERGGVGRGPSADLQRNRIHRALSRPNLLMGADRELVRTCGHHSNLRRAHRLFGSLWDRRVDRCRHRFADHGQGRSDDAAHLYPPYLHKANELGLF